MSALQTERDVDDAGVTEDAVVAGTPVVIRRNAGLAALVGAGASAVAIAYLWRASQTLAVLDWALCGVMAVLAVVYLATFLDSRTPLLVADDLGVRIRLGKDWRGLPWEAVRQAAVRPRRGLLRDGRIVFVPESLGRALEGLDGRGRRQVRLNQKMYGAALAVPVGVTTRVTGRDGRRLVEALEALALGRAEVVDLTPQETESRPEEPRQEESRSDEARPEEADEQAPAPEAREAEPQPVADATPTDRADVDEPATPGSPRRRTLLGGIGTIVSRMGKRRDVAERGDAVTEPDPVAAVPLRVTRGGLRADVTWDRPVASGADATEVATPVATPVAAPVDERPSPDLARVRPISKPGDPVEPLVIADFVTEPAYDPVIGPELAASRNRLGLSVDELAERTRIRPHVIESIEVDDFAPCGGDFYARGHLRTLARVLGKDVAPLLEVFEERYATAPINARKVFEAELATGMTGSMRSTMGGPSWGLLVGFVLVLAIVWGVARLFSSEPAALVQQPAPVLNGSAGLGPADPGAAGGVAEPVRMTVRAAHGASKVTVRNGDGAIVFSGLLERGQKKTMSVPPPAHVQAADAGAIEVSVRGRDRGTLGSDGERGRRTFR